MLTVMCNPSMEAKIPIDGFIFGYPLRNTIAEHYTLRPFFENVPEQSVGAEIGAFECNNAYFVCKYNKPKLLYLIDPYLKYIDVIGDLSDLTQENWDDLFKRSQEKMDGFPVRFIRKKSYEAVDDIKDESLDFCYIDGDHSLAEIRRDLRIWFPKVKKGGMFGGHDATEPEVRQAVTEWSLAEGRDFTIGFNDWGVLK